MADVEDTTTSTKTVPEKLPDGWLNRLRRAVVPETTDGPGLLAIASGVISIAAIYLYFAGYIYCLFYYRGFGVTLESLDLSTQYFFVHSYPVLSTVWGLALLIAFGLAVYGFAAGLLRRWVLLVWMIGAFPAIYYISYGAAREAVASKRANPTSFVRFRFKDDDAKKSVADGGTGNGEFSTQQVVKLGDAGQLFLLLETKDRVVVFYQPPSPLPGLALTSAVQVYTLLRSDLKWVVVTTQ
jgi:hypothetical protein